MKTRLYFLTFFILLPHLARADVYSTNVRETEYIRVIPVGSDTIEFYKCRLCAHTCDKEPLGGREFSLNELATARQEFLAKGIKTAALDVGIIAGAWFVGAYVGILASAHLSGSIVADVWGYLIGSTCGLTTSTYSALQYLNPIEPFHQRGLISSNVANRKTVYIRGKISKFAIELDRVLRRIR